jgi:aminomethyltransferase
MAALKRIRETGVTRKIVGVTMDGDPFPELNNIKWPASSEGSVVGKVTSAVYSPRLKSNIGFAWVPAGLESLGTTLTIASEWGERKATVVDMPFVDPNKQIPLS